MILQSRLPTFHAVLGGLGLLLAVLAHHRHHGHVHQAEVLPAHPQLQLTQRLHKRHGLDVSWR